MFQQINIRPSKNSNLKLKTNDLNNEISAEPDQYQHSETILNGLQLLKSNKILCDVTLIAESKICFHLFTSSINS